MNQNVNSDSTLSFIYKSIWSNHQLISQLAKREVVGRYRGSLLGIFWSFLNPILMLAIYTIFFTVAIKAQWSGGEAKGHADFAIILFVGLIIQTFFAECLNKAPTLVVQNANYVKKVIFPLEILPIVAVISALSHAAISLTILLFVQILFQHSLSSTFLFFPLVILPFVMMVLGFTWVLAALGVYVRDISHVTGVLTTILLFMSPVFYPLSSLPLKIQPWLMINPLTFMIEQSRNVLLYSELPNWSGLFIYYLISFLIALVGFWCFQKMRKGFADVL